MLDWVLTKLIARERSWSWSPSNVAEKFITVVLVQMSEGSLGSRCRHTRNNLVPESVFNSNSHEVNTCTVLAEWNRDRNQAVSKHWRWKTLVWVRQLALPCSKRAPHLKEELYSISVFPTLSNSWPWLDIVALTRNGSHIALNCSGTFCGIRIGWL